MDSEEIERLAEAFLAQVPDYVWDGRSLPVLIEEIADSHAGLLVRDVEDLSMAPGAPRLQEGQTLSGLLLPARGEIWVNAAEARLWPARRRFTIAHELGHWELHHDGAAPAFCRATAIDGERATDSPASAADRPPTAADRSTATAHPPAASAPTQAAGAEPPAPAELEANQFAAAVLMPAALLREFYRALGGDSELLCRTFASSGAAMGRRLHAVIGRSATAGAGGQRAANARRS